MQTRRHHLLSLGAVTVDAAVGRLSAWLPHHLPHFGRHARLCASLYGALQLLVARLWQERGKETLSFV